MKKPKQFLNVVPRVVRNLRRKSESILFSFVLFLLITPGYAQEKPISVGSVSTFYQSLKPSASKISGSNKKSVKVKNGESVNLNIQQNRQTSIGEVFIGKVENKKSSYAFFTYKDGALNGKVIIPDQKKAYAYSTVDGIVWAVPEDINKALCIEYQKVQKSAAVSSNAGAPPVGSAAYTLQSLPGASAVVLLDFDGHDATGSYWGNIIAEPATVSESDILEVWKVVSEDFRPYVLNITTSEAVYQAAPVNKRMRCVVTPTPDAAPGSGGVAFIGAFTTGGELAPCWVFNGSQSNGYGGQLAGETASHEIGHTMGLGHDGRELPEATHEEYYGGNGYWAPIMGVSFSAPLSHWSIGEYQYANNTEDDYTKIGTQNGFGFRSDEAGSTIGTAKPLFYINSGSRVIPGDSNIGIIGSRTDVDLYSFSSTGGTAVINVGATAAFSNLDILVSILNSSGSVIATSNPENSLEATIKTVLGAGQYYLSIDGTGKGDPFLLGYSDYSSLGQYKISGNIQLANTPPTISLTAPLNNAVYKAPATFQIDASVGDLEGPITKVEFYQNNVKISEDNLYPSFYGYANNLPQGTYTFFAKVFDQGGLTAVSDPVTVTVDGTAPTISIAFPANNAQFTAPASFYVGTTVNDTEGPIAKVEFYQNNVKIGEDAFYPGFQWNVTNLPAGTYVYTAKAFDQAGWTTVSAPITVIVNPSPCLVDEASPAAAQFILRNDWWDQQSGSVVSDESGTLKVVHRAYGQNELWVLQTGKTFSVTNGQTYNVKIDFKDFASLGVSGIDAAFATGTITNGSGPVLTGSAVSFPSGFSSASFTTKSVNITSNYTGTVFVAFKLKWANQPNFQTLTYFKNIKVCPGTGTPSREAFSATIETEVEVQNISISPNPTESDFKAYTKRGISLLSVSDLQGKQVYGKENIDKDSLINFGEDFTLGFYIVNVKYDDGTQQSFKIIKTK